MTPQEREARIRTLARRIIKLLDKPSSEAELQEYMKVLDVESKPIKLESDNGDFIELKRLIEERHAELPRG